MANNLDVTRKEYVLLLSLALFGVLAIYIGLEMIPSEDDEQQPVPFVKGSEETEAWCERMLDKPNQSWSESETLSFADFCLLDD